MCQKNQAQPSTDKKILTKNTTQTTSKKFKNKITKHKHDKNNIKLQRYNHQKHEKHEQTKPKNLTNKVKKKQPTMDSKQKQKT